MKRSFTLTAALVFFTLALTFSEPHTTRTVEAVEEGDKCARCLEKIGRDYEKCVAKYGEVDPFCGEQLNQDVIRCYATVCEQ